MRAFDAIFAIARADELDTRTEVIYSMFEVYNEKIRDLLHTNADSTSSPAFVGAGASGTGSRAAVGAGAGAGAGVGAGVGAAVAGSTEQNLEVRLGKHGVYVENLSEWPVGGVDEVASLFARGNHNRSVASNNVNEHSSRSHLVILVKVRVKIGGNGSGSDGGHHTVVG